MIEFHDLNQLHPVSHLCTYSAPLGGQRQFCHSRPCIIVMWVLNSLSVFFFSLHRSHMNLYAGRPTFLFPGVGVYCMILMLWAFLMCNDFAPIFGKTFSHLSQGYVSTFTSSCLILSQEKYLYETSTYLVSPN